MGNIGNPVIDTIETSSEESVLVTELSSFQLESIDEFRPKVSAILNITEDHLNRTPYYGKIHRSKAQIYL
ncbi:Mur ligase family protein [Clostridioides difficile]|uniref:Mur ligase family protein n=1 Tax=Clostridioides difficile TaxID=1496 RepID=UPI001EFF1257|nr:Mur ligase family protein [Clostridioides difficile]